MPHEQEPRVPNISIERYEADKAKRLMPPDIESEELYIFRYKVPGPITAEAFIWDLYARVMMVIEEPDHSILSVNFMDMKDQAPRKVYLKPDGIAFNGRRGTLDAVELPLEQEAGYFMNLADQFLDEELVELARRVKATSGAGRLALV
jgi:hypothetical protein